jgi:hypothetical protein
MQKTKFSGKMKNQKQMKKNPKQEAYSSKGEKQKAGTSAQPNAKLSGSRAQIISNV